MEPLMDTDLIVAPGAREGDNFCRPCCLGRIWLILRERWWSNVSKTHSELPGLRNMRRGGAPPFHRRR